MPKRSQTDGRTSPHYATRDADHIGPEHTGLREEFPKYAGRSIVREVRRGSRFRVSGASPVVLTLGFLASGVSGFAGTMATPAGTFAGCPRGPLPLTGALASYAPAARTRVLSFVRARAIQLKLKVGGARANRVLRVSTWLPSGWIKSECGLLDWKRSLAVGVFFPTMDPAHNPVGRCASCASITYLIAKLPRGWVVWGNY